MARVARMVLDLALATSKALRPPFATAWQYAKIEIVPPMTIAFFNGPAGKNLENKVAQFVDGFISGLETKIKDMDEAEARAIREKEAKLKAAEEKAKAKLKEQQKKQAAEAAATAKKAEEAKKAEDKAKEEKAKAEKKDEKPKEDKKPPKK
ncbi:caldesmon-like [Pectinophora gossypiella]|uniref:caldesmon-like n=1 Tax=Pectinophora gossypiella TaxID=13191 RepID=UPI00214F607C|nr:caldesmon-like [Pectinophora gossypiella]